MLTPQAQAGGRQFKSLGATRLVWHLLMPEFFARFPGTLFFVSLFFGQAIVACGPVAP